MKSTPVNSKLANVIHPIQSAVQRTKTVESIKVESLSAVQITDDLAELWQQMRRAHPLQISPYFDLAFTQAVDSVRDDVEVAVFHSDGKIIAFYPFQRVASHHAEPVGGRLNDAQGLIGGEKMTPRQLVRGLESIGITSAAFHAAIKPNGPFDHFEFRQMRAHHLDLSQGWESFYQWAKKHSSTIKRHGQKLRAMEREHGELRFEFDCRCDATMEQLIHLKRSKYQRTKTFDILSVQWASDLLRHMHHTKTKKISGILSTLHAGDRLVAAHFGMVTDQLLHYWFPTFDSEFNRYSPGTELLLRVARECCDRGLKKLDLGYGDDSYKFKFCNSTDPASCGRITDSKLGFQIAKTRHIVRQRLKGIPLKPTVKQVLRKVYPEFGGWNFK